jgi:putative flippase GtrA
MLYVHLVGLVKENLIKMHGVSNLKNNLLCLFLFHNEAWNKFFGVICLTVTGYLLHKTRISQLCLMPNTEIYVTAYLIN